MARGKTGQSMLQTTQVSRLSSSRVIDISVRLGCLLTLSVFSTIMFSPPPASAQAALDEQTVHFVADVLCGTEFGENKDKRCTRWVKAPAISTFGSGSHHPTVIANVVRQLNECLPSEIQVKLLGPGDDSADIKVYFVALDECQEVAKQNGFTYISDNYGLFNVEWNDDYEIFRATVIIADDKLRGRRLHHYLLEEVTQCFGMAGDSNQFENSVFYEDESKNKFGTATRLSDLDRKLIRFLYRSVKPGSRPVELGIQLARYWQ